MTNNILVFRANIIRAVRDFFWNEGFLEVETPLLIPANAPEEHIEPLLTTLPPFSWQLQTSPEICMKRLLCRGHRKIFQISHCWRANERGTRHLTEFTMLEWYRTDSSYHDLMADCKNLLEYVVKNCSLDGIPCFSYDSFTADPARPWEYISVTDAFLKHANKSVYDCLADGSYEDILTCAVEPALARYKVPVVLMDYPAELASLAKTKDDNSAIAERFELYVCGVELANGFSELCDNHEQRRRFESVNCSRNKAGLSKLPLPELFLNDLKQMPQSAGIALGIDRLVMLRAGKNTIDEVVSFTTENL